MRRLTTFLAAASMVSMGLIGVTCADAQVYTYESTIGVTSAPGTDNAHFNMPAGGSVDSVNNHYFVADALNSRVQVFNTADLSYAGTIGVTGVPGSDENHFNGPLDVAYDRNTDRLFVTDFVNDRVQVLDAKSFAYVGTIGIAGVSGNDNSHLDGPFAARINPVAGQLYVADAGNQRIQIFDTSSLAYIATIGTSGVSGDDNTHLNQPNDAEYNSLTNQIMVSDANNNRVQFFDAASFQYVGTIGALLSVNHENNTSFIRPASVIFDQVSNLVLVSDLGNSRIQVFDAQTMLSTSTDGYIMTLGTTVSPGTENNQFEGAVGFAIDAAHGRLLIGDQGNDRIQVFQINPSAIGAAVLPGSRSVEVGTTATIFATMINSGTSALSNCLIALPASAPAGLALSYQPTNPTTNAPTGSADTPVTIPGNDGTQSFVVSFKGSAPSSASEMALDFSCSGQASAPSITGVDTVDLTLSSTPVADIIALAATATNDGIAQIPNGGVGAFAVATDNLGVTAAITVSVDTGGAALPVTATICQSNPSTGACLSAPGGSVALNFAAGATPTFSVFVTSSGTTVPFNPGASRIFVRFKDANGSLHGSTSVAIETTP